MSAAPPSFARDLASVVAGLSFPLLVHLGASRFGARTTGAGAALVVALLLARRLRAGARTALDPFLLAAGALGIATLALDDARALRLVPALASALACRVFVDSLRAGRMPVVEQVARSIEGDALPGYFVPWLRAMTRVWAGFLLVNTALCAGLALAAPLAAWTAWTAGGFYLASGLLLAGEWVVRKLRWRWYRDGLVDRALARVFPAHAPGPASRRTKSDS